MAGVTEEVLRGGGGGDDDLLAGLDGDLLMVLEQAGADLGALGVKQDADCHVELGSDAADALDAAVMLLIRAVGEVEAGDVHARLHHFAQRLVVVAGRAHRADNFRAFIHAVLQLHTAFMGLLVQRCIIGEMAGKIAAHRRKTADYRICIT